MRTAFLSALVASTLLLTAAPASAATVTRVAGTNQYETAIAVSQALVPDPAAGPRAAVIVSGDDAADVLVGPVIAGELLGGAPVLMVRSDQPLERIVEDELRRLQVQRVVIVGGTNRVSTAVQDRIATFSAVERINGADRYETAARVSQRHARPGAETTVFVVTGEANTEATAGVLSAAVFPRSTVLLTRRDSLPRATRDELRRLAGAEVLVIGGTSVISGAVRSAIASAAGTDLREQSGRDRYETQVSLVDLIGGYGAERVHLVSGETWQNALVAAPYARAQQQGTVTFLVRKDCVPGVTLDFMADAGLTELDRTIVGGPGNVSDAAGNLRRC